MKNMLCWSLAMTAWLWAEPGTFYYAEGGTGGGIVHLLTPRGLVKLRWKKENFDASGVKPVEAWRWGARWDFRHEEGWLSQARYLKQQDQAVTSAMAALQSHLSHLRNSDFPAAYAGVSSQLKRAQALRAFSGLSWKASPPTYAYKVIGHNPEEVLVMIDNQELWNGGRNAYRFTLQKQSEKWTITEIRAFSKSEFEEA
jgi:hypothetical protein